MNLTFGSVCSGIEAASVAWGPLGWTAAWLAEIEPFPSAVLAHHYPDVTNLGDMTLLPARIAAGEVAAPDVFTGGTPCQAFSVAGLRRSLDDARGNLSLVFCEIADAIDDVRRARGDDPCIVVWENVPGVLSTKDNAFGCFLSALAGCDTAIDPGRIGWTDAGVVAGPRRTVAWRILDAQYFGLAQRRKRVFVVASARTGFDPAAVLFEFDGVRRDSPPCRTPSEGVARGAAPCLDASFGRLQGCSGQDANHGHGHLIPQVAFGGNRTSGPIDVAPALNACGTASGRQDFETEAFITTTHTLRGEGFDASEGGTGRGTPLVPVNFQASQSGMRVNDTVGTLDANYGSRRHNGVMVPVARTFDTVATLDARSSAGGFPGTDGACGGHVVPVAFHPTQDPISSVDGTTHAMSCGSKGGKATVAVAFDSKESNTLCSVELSPCLTTNGETGKAGGRIAVQTAMQVRRLTPRECERLQGFPDDYTLIPWRGKPADQCPDGPRYKALGNSWAVPVVRWIGARIDAALHGGAT